MKSHLSHILPVWEAAEILGPSVVRRMVISLLQLRASTTSSSSSNNNNNNSTTTTNSNGGGGGVGGGSSQRNLQQQQQQPASSSRGGTAGGTTTTVVDNNNNNGEDVGNNGRNDSNSTSLKDDVDQLVEALFYKPPSQPAGRVGCGGGGGGSTTSTSLQQQQQVAMGGLLQPQQGPPMPAGVPVAGAVGNMNQQLHQQQQLQQQQLFVANHHNNTSNNAAMMAMMMAQQQQQQHHVVTVPTHIDRTWKRWMSSRSLSMDKTTLIAYLVPTGVQPHGGPSGHMGLFDCWVYTLQGHALTNQQIQVQQQTTTQTNQQHPNQQAQQSSSSATTNAPKNASPAQQQQQQGSYKAPNARQQPAQSQQQQQQQQQQQLQCIWLPDVIILLAICKQYRDLQLRVQRRRRRQRRADQQQQQQQTASMCNGVSGANDVNNNDHDDDDDNNHQEYKQDENDDDIISEDDDNNNDSSQQINKIIRTMSLLAYRIYDSYQKKGEISRDTIHRFLTDVHGEESYKTTNAIGLLDDIFSDYQSGYLHATVSETKFCTRLSNTIIMKTGRTNNNNNNENGGSGSSSGSSADNTATTTTGADGMNDDNNNDNTTKKVSSSSTTLQEALISHLLLDWVAILGCAMIPLDEIPMSVSAYLEKMNQSSPPICDLYQLADHRLYEIKRRFHSLVQSSSAQNVVIHGDPMGGGGGATTTTSTTNNGNASSSSSSSIDIQLQQHSSSSPSSQQQQQQPPKHAITQEAFCASVSTINEELGWGGYMPKSLARCIFRAGCRNNEDDDEEYDEDYASGQDDDDVVGCCDVDGDESRPGNARRSSSSFSFVEDEDEDDDRLHRRRRRPLHWLLFHVLQFGCLAVRKDRRKNEHPDIPMLRFLFRTFQLAASSDKRQQHRGGQTAPRGDDANNNNDDQHHTNNTNNNNDTNGGAADTHHYHPTEDVGEGEDFKRILTRSQVTLMMWHLIRYASFRNLADRPKDLLDEEEEEDDTDHHQNGGEGNVDGNHGDHKTRNGSGSKLSRLESRLVDESLASRFRLLPPTASNSGGGGGSSNNGRLDGGTKDHRKSKASSSSTPTTVPLKVLVDYAMKGTAVEGQMTFDEFCRWNASVEPTTDIGSEKGSHPRGAQRNDLQQDGPRATEARLSGLLMELRLIAAVMFGIPPTLASMELSIVKEIERRHGLRYPQTAVSRRGPRGTVWYLIDEAWFRTWHSAVNKVQPGTVVDAADGRGTTAAPGSAASRTGRVRELGRISNTSLLVDNGSLALRGDIRWKDDYDLLPPMSWSALQAWYDGGPPIYRTVVRYIAMAASGATGTGSGVGGASPHSTVARPKIPTENEIELYPFFVRIYLCDAASRGEARPFQQNYQLSRVSPVGMVLVQLCKELFVDPDAARLWVMGTETNDGNSSGTVGGGVSAAGVGSVSHGSVGSVSAAVGVSSSLSSDPSNSSGGGGRLSEDWILNLDMNIIEQRKRRAPNARGTGGAGGGSGISLLLELKDKETNLWPRGLDGKEWAFREKTPKQESASSLGDGVVGLYNMGNTCYMNSSIQCVSHTPILREYFTSKAYLKDINTTNPLGHQGHLAQVSAVLINSLWKRFNQASPHQPKRVKAPGSYAPVNAPSLTPKTFKESLGKFNEHFSGNEQHDAQEVLAFLLGGLSEDLNRIVDKPYIEAPDSDGRPDCELADIWWSNHLKREMSIIVALFTGQYKSLLTCRTCKYQSARFEPFSFLQLPLPEDDHHAVSLILYPIREGADTLKYCVRVRNDGKLRDVLVALAKVLHNDELEASGQKVPCSNGSGESGKVEDNESKDEHEEIYQQRAKNLAVVDMRDGYILKIAPFSWNLQDLQNKDTGELPLLHVYELDPVPPVVTRPADSDADTIDSSVDSETDKKPHASFLAVAQRRSDVASKNYLHPMVHRVFGTPLLLRVADLDNCTGSELYDLVARRLRNVVPKSALRFLSTQSIKKRSGEGSSGSSTAKCRPVAPRDDIGCKTTTDMEEVSAGSVPRYGFRLRITSRDGRRCLSCAWFECCIGCLVPDDDNQTVVMDGDSVVVDWHFAVDVATSGFGMRSSPTDPLVSQQPNQNRVTRAAVGVPVKSHASCGSGSKKGGPGGVITLEECLDAFAEEEKIPEAYCSKCKDFRVQTKRMSLWRLPPIVIIHLKRFQFTQQLRRKLRELVLFPVEGLDLSRIMAGDAGSPTATVSQERVAKKNADSSSEDATKRNDSKNDTGGEDDDQTAATETTATAAAEDGIKDKGRSVMLYDLYAVVHHQGALSGGHYVASIKSELDGQWRMFNDAQIYEIHARDVVDSSAYILFYIRRDAAKAKLSDFWDVREGEGPSDEDMDQLLKSRSDRCVVS